VARKRRGVREEEAAALQMAALEMSHV